MTKTSVFCTTYFRLQDIPFTGVNAGRSQNNLFLGEPKMRDISLVSPRSLCDAKVWCVLLFSLISCTLGAAQDKAQPHNIDGHSLIRRDNYGVPHILADTEQAAAYAQGYATAEDHFDELARLFLRARGEQAAVFGQSFVKQDLLVRELGIWDKARDRFEDLPPHMQAILDAYAQGYDLYLSQHRASAPDWAKPVTGIDVLAHCRAVLLLDFALDLRPWEEVNSGAGSNMWAIGRERSASGRGILLANPHLPWTGSDVFHEIQLTVPGKINVTGATLLVFPVVTIGFNEASGWTQTVNDHRSDDVYELTLNPANPMEYLYDGLHLPLRSRLVSIKVKSGKRQILTTRKLMSCHFGPIIRVIGNKAYAYKSANLDLVNFLTEYNLMGKAKSFTQFRIALEMQQLPMFNLGYADREGNIYYLFNARIPIRSTAVNWDGVVRGDTSDAEWYAVHPIADLPQLFNPPGGYIQNANDAPWFTTLEHTIDPAPFLNYITGGNGGLSLRSQISLQMLESKQRLTLEDVKQFKYNETIGAADRLKSDLISLAKEQHTEGADLSETVDVLDKWNDQADLESQGAVLFVRWWEEYRSKASPIFKQPWTADSPITTPRGIGDPQQALAALVRASLAVKNEKGSLAVRWGDIHRLRRGNVDIPIGGSFGAFRTVGYNQDSDHKWIASDGDSYVLAVEFTDPPTAVSVLAYSESSNKASTHSTDQSELFASKGYKPVWFTEAELQKHIESTYAPGRRDYNSTTMIGLLHPSQ